jgi:hypothetical protein
VLYIFPNASIQIHQVTFDERSRFRGFLSHIALKALRETQRIDSASYAVWTNFVNRVTCKNEGTCLTTAVGVALCTQV